VIARATEFTAKKEKNKRGMYMLYLPTPSAEVMRIGIIGQIEACGSSTVVIIDVSCTVQLCECVISSRWIINRLAHLDHPHNTIRSKVSKRLLYSSKKLKKLFIIIIFFYEKKILLYWFQRIYNLIY
jgi:hypothetical protein